MTAEGEPARAAGDEGRRPQDRRRRRLGLPDGPHRRPGRRGHRLGRRHRRGQPVGAAEPARDHDGPDARGQPGGAARGAARAAQLSTSRSARCRRAGERRARRDPVRQGGGRRHGQARRRLRLPRRRHRGHPRGIPVFAQFGITPQTALRYGVTYSATPTPGDEVPAEMSDELVAEAKRLEEAGAALLNFTNSGPVVGPAVAQAVSIPVLGGFGGGPWLDGRMRMATAAIGYAASRWTTRRTRTPTSPGSPTTRSPPTPTDVRAARQITGGIPVRARTRRSSVPTAVVDGIVTRYEVTGSGPPLLMFSPGRLQRHSGELGGTAYLPAREMLSPARRAVHLHHVRPAGVRPVRAGGSSGSPGPTTSPRASACSTIWASSGPT